MDITNEWTKTKGMTGTITGKQEYIVNGVTYKVDGRHVVLHPTEQEKKVAMVLSEKYGKSVEFVPQIVFPQGIQTPDYMVDGDRIEKQIEELYTSPRVGFLEKVILMKDAEVLKVYGRK